MIKFFIALDRGVRKFLTGFCVLMLFMMVMFTVYTIIMRYIFGGRGACGARSGVVRRRSAGQR